MVKENLILTGFMGTGKSTVGKLLAQRLDFDFVDTDELIETHEGRSIADIFREEGEAAFRRLEAQAAADLSQQHGLVVATGGRLMLDQANAAALSGTGRVFCLTATPDEILARLVDDEGRRPLIDVPQPEERIRMLLEERADGYGRFPQINTSGRSPEQIVAEIQLMIDKEILPVTYPHGTYNVVVGSDLLPHIRHLASIKGPLALITDSNVCPLHADRCDTADFVVTIPAGEQFKTLATVNYIYDQLLTAGLDRQGTILALGGGVVGDVAGFVAATYLRGVDLVQCPTSLLAMVDASVGAKTGVDLPQGKNLVGAFKQPVAVFADLATLSTLPAEEFSAGMAEVIKAGLIADPDLFKALEAEMEIKQPSTPSDALNLRSVVTRSINVKRVVVQEDPFEKGRRAVLNLGHTFGHAIEQVSGYAVRHGEAVGIGLVAAAHLSTSLGLCSESIQLRIEAVLEKAGLPRRIPMNLSPVDLHLAMGNDKKKASGRLHFILIRDVGDVFISGDVSDEQVLTTLAACLESK